MSDERARDEQTEWFHQFADQAPDQIAANANEANRSAVASFVSLSLPDHPMPDDLSPEEFADAVMSLRESERAWNRAVCTALIQADDLHISHDDEQAFAVLQAFAKSCPWSPFREVAENQAQNYSTHP